MAKVDEKNTLDNDAVAPSALISDSAEGAGIQDNAKGFIVDLCVAAGCAGVPTADSKAWETWLDDVYRRPNLPSFEGRPEGHMKGAYFFDDLDGECAKRSLHFAWRRWAERAFLSGDPGAVALQRLLRLAIVAMQGDAPNSEDRVRALGGLGAQAEDILREWTAPARAQRLSGLQNKVGELVAGLKEATPADVLAAAARTGSDETMFYLRTRFILPEELWEAPDLARLVLCAASDALVGWSSGASMFPARDEHEHEHEHAESLARALTGTLSRGVPHLTHKGASLEERGSHADRVAAAIGLELRERRSEFYSKLYTAECTDKHRLSQGQPARYLAPERQDVAFRIAVCAFTGLNVANGVEPRRARKDAENTLSNARKRKV